MPPLFSTKDFLAAQSSERKTFIAFSTFPKSQSRGQSQLRNWDRKHQQGGCADTTRSLANLERCAILSLGSVRRNNAETSLFSLVLKFSMLEGVLTYVLQEPCLFNMDQSVIGFFAFAKLDPLGIEKASAKMDSFFFIFTAVKVRHRGITTKASTECPQGKTASL